MSEEKFLHFHLMAITLDLSVTSSSSSSGSCSSGGKTICFMIKEGYSSVLLLLLFCHLWWLWYLYSIDVAKEEMISDLWQSWSGGSIKDC